MTTEALPDVGEAVRRVAADLRLTTIRAEQGWEAFAKAAGRRFGEAGHLAAFQLRTEAEWLALQARRQADAEEWRSSPTFARDVSRIKDRADRADHSGAGPESMT